MTYRRLRIAVLVLVALNLLFGPTPGGRADPGPAAPTVAAARALRVPAPQEPPGPVGISVPPSPSGSGAAGSKRPSGQPSPPGSRSPSATSTVGPGGATKRTGSTGVALTFDDGPDPVHTPMILDLLRRHGVKATFCLVGFRARDHPDLVRRIAAEGHTLCNHSWQHRVDLARRPEPEIRADLEQTNAVIRTAVPDARIRYFRAPGGNFTPRLVALARDYGMASIYWHVDPRDWEHRTTSSDQEHIERVIAVVQEQTRPGSIVLSHDNRQPTTIVAYRTLLPWLKARFTLIALPG